jgi:transposase InsO family protein
VLEIFERWAMDFIRPINPPSNKKLYILVCTDYMPKWVETKELIRASEEFVLAFMFEDIFVRFGVPRELITDGGPPFTSHKLEVLLSKYHVLHRINSPYHPQGNG